jgi:formylglycine-generating enzyme required for sulfatase activity
VLLALLVLLLNACGSGSGNGDNSLSGQVNSTRAYYQILDVASGQVSASGPIADLATNPLYRTSKIVFRLIENTSGRIGTAANELGAALDPTATTVSAPAYYVAVFETTQAQWESMAGNTPWAQLSSADGSDDIRIGDDYPAIGLSNDLVATMTQTYRTSHGVRLALPTDVQWELACRAGSSGTWSWGAQDDSATVAAAAVVWETADNVRGARQVAGRQPNAMGLYDAHGNVWELTTSEHLRGGSWNDPVTSARAANRAVIDTATRHLLVGARLVYVP